MASYFAMSLHIFLAPTSVSFLPLLSHYQDHPRTLISIGLAVARQPFGCFRSLAVVRSINDRLHVVGGDRFGPSHGKVQIQETCS